MLPVEVRVHVGLVVAAAGIITIITGTLLRLWRCPSSPILGQTLSIVPCLSIAYTFIIIIIVIVGTARCIFEYLR